MASFTDNKTPTFNPYVQQQPVESMVKVGMAKQQQYDQGVQRIQQSYNDIAGLDVMKDADKAYIESKLSETTSNLRGFAAGDFSNSQLTSSVTGMIKGISRDENIKNAVHATQRVRSELSKANTAEVTGKSSVVNQWALNNQINTWMNDEQVGSSFLGGYVPYTDVDQKLRDVYEKIEETETQTENPFIRDASGNTLYFSPDGKQSSITPQDGWESRADHAMLSTIIKGKSSQKILDNFMTSLNADDIRQLGLNADYHYKSVDSNTLKGEFSKRISNKRDQYNTAITDIDLELATNKNLTPVQKEQYKAVRNKYSSALENGDLDKELEEGLQALNDPANVKQFKHSIYTDNYLNNMAKDLATQSIKQTYESNPYFQASMDLKNLQFKYDNAARDQANKDRTYGFKVMELAWKKEKYVNETLLDQEQNGVFVTDAAKETKGSEYTITSLQSEINELIGSPEERKLNGGHGSSGRLGQLNAMYAPLLVDKNRDPGESLKYLNGLSEKYMEDPSSINDINDPNLREYLEKRRELDIEIARKTGLYAAVQNDPISLGYDDQIEESLAAQEPVVSTDGTQYSGKDVLDFLSTAGTMYTVPKTIRLDSKTYQDIMILDTEALEEYYRGTRQESAAKAYAKHHRGEDLTIDEERFISEFRELGRDSHKIAGDINNMKKEYQEKYIKTRSPEAQTQVGIINNENKRDINAAKALAQLKINQVNTGVGELDNYKSGEFAPEVAAEYIKDKNAGYVIKKDYNGEAVLEIQSGGGIQTLPLTDQELQTYFPEAAVSNPLNRAKQLILSSPIHSTNLKQNNSADAGVSAYFNGNQIPGIANESWSHKVRMDIIGSPYNNGSDNDRFYLQLYYVDDGGHWITDKTRRYTSMSGIQTMINMVQPSTIKTMITDQKLNLNPQK